MISLTTYLVVLRSTVQRKWKLNCMYSLIYFRFSNMGGSAKDLSRYEDAKDKNGVKVRK